MGRTAKPKPDSDKWMKTLANVLAVRPPKARIVKFSLG
jgi:hypothetical protein